MGKKITQLATITEVADDDLIVGVDVSDTSGSDNGTNKKFTKATLLDGLAPLNPQLTGWNPDAETWIYHSVDDPTGYFKIEGKDVSANYSVGWRIMFTNGGNVIKGIITAITYSDPDTIITFLHEIDPTDNQALYLLTNSAITENYFSPHKAPLGFPMSPVKWTVKVTLGSGNQQSPVNGTWYNIASNIITVPIGCWDIGYLGQFAIVGSGGHMVVWVTLSNANNTEWNEDLTVHMESSAGITQLGYTSLSTSTFLTIAAKTALYLNLKTTSPNTTGVYITTPSRAWATCAYL
jgi:hypothetical protein